MEPDNHEAWLVIFYRDGTDDSVKHNQPYSQYESYQRLGNLYNTILRIELTANKIKHIMYYHLSISSKESGYRLNVGNYNGTLPNYLSHHNNNPFLNPDKDTNSYNCANLHQGGWCTMSAGMCSLLGRPLRYIA
uniref:Fibrinogen C-terminal domain-containing protein n=1 Tax=Amphimedon queenslandica TaxID=400682 RepID=A0A1X7U2V5_AMPQE